MEDGCSYPDQAVLTNAKECLYFFDRTLEHFDLPEDTVVLSDEIVVIGTTQNRSKNAFRLLKVLDSNSNQLNLVSNRFDLSADEIAELCKSRWAIELFFKWMKQHLNIKKFYTQTEQGVHNQVYLAMIVYCLNVLITVMD